MSALFGIGCFHFGVKKAAPFTFKWSEYIGELRKALGSVASIDNIEILANEDEDDWSTSVTQDLTPMNEGIEGFFPAPDFFEIRFDVYIPFRIQSQLLELPADILPTATERFNVTIRYTYHWPVAFVRLVEPRAEADPSKAVKVIREFLRSELKSNYIRIEYLGPSPFHCEFSLEANDNTTGTPFECGIDAVRGYDKVRFSYHPHTFDSETEAYEHLMDELEGELGFFYDLVASELQRSRMWRVVESRVDSLLSVRRGKGVFSWMKRIFRYPGLLNEAFISIADFESGGLFDDQVTQRDYREQYNSGKIGGYLQRYVDEEMRQRVVYPTAQTRELVRFLEERHMKTTEIFVALISAVVGGAVGALLAGWLGQGQAG